MINLPLPQVPVGQNTLITALSLQLILLWWLVLPTWFLSCQDPTTAVKIREPDSFLASLPIIYDLQETDFKELSKNIVASVTHAFLYAFVKGCPLSHPPGYD